MSDGNDTQTREQLLAEIAALKEQLAQRDAVAGKATAENAAVAGGQTAGGPPDSKAASAPVFAAPMTRRRSIVSWIAPVILSLPVVQAVGAVIKPGTAQAQVTDDVAPVALPTSKPTVAPSIKKAAPTVKATAKPTVAATAAPTAAPTTAPTAAATLAPTKVGRCIISPTAAPTIGLASTPDSRPVADGFVALGEARALVRGDIGP